MRKTILIGLILLCILPLCKAGDLSIILTGGIRYGLFGDVNAGILGYLGLFSDSGTYNSGVIIDEIKSLHFSPYYSAEIGFGLGSGYSLSICVGQVRVNNLSKITIRYPEEIPEANGRIETAINAIPLGMRIYRQYVLNRVLSAYFVGGVEVCPVRFRSVSWPAGQGNTIHQNAHSVGLGLLYGAGLEVKANSHIALILEARGNYEKVRAFRGTLLAEGSSLPYEETGVLYRWDQAVTIGPDLQGTYTYLMIRETMPSGDIYSHVRSANVDLSGFALAAGVRIFF